MKEQHGPIREESKSQAGAKIRHFGNYDLIRRIDVGGMGEVYLVRQRTAFGREVAIKIMRSDLVHDQIARKRFLREAEVSAHLLHEHILTLIEFSEEDGRLFLVTPYIKGGTLARRLRRGPLTLGEVYQLFSALVQAVAYIHKRGVVHRDLKPANILLDSEEGSNDIYVRLIDFGIASVTNEMSNAPLTLAGQELGTAAYMAPERLSGVSAPSNDIYSLGVILYEMTTGSLPPVSGKLTTLPQPLGALVRCCMAINPEERFASAEELLSAFEQAYEAMRSKAPQIQGHTASSPVLPPPEKNASSGRMAAIKVDQSATLNEVLVHRGEFVLSPLPGNESVFQREDYEAPTSHVDPTELPRYQVSLADSALMAPPPPGQATPKQSQKRKGSLFGLMIAAIIAVLFVIGGMSYMIFQTSISASIVVVPRVQTVSHVMTLSANPNLHSVDTASSSLPAYVLNSNKTVTQSGATTGQVGCFLGIGKCQQAVSVPDIDNEVAQIRPKVRAEIQQDLQQQARNMQCTIVDDIYYTDSGLSIDPPVGSVSQTVTVALSDAGSVECVKTQDLHSLVLALFARQVPQNYALVDSLTQIGPPVVQSVGFNGVVKMAVPVAGVARYQVSDQELATIRTHVKGLKPAAAQSYIATMPGLDTTATSVHLSYGDSIPTNVQQIQVKTTDPVHMPAVHLPKA